MEKRVFLAVGLSVAVLLGWTVLFPPPKRPAPGAAAPQTTAAPQNQQSGGSALERPAPVALPSPAAPPAQTLVGDSTERQIVFENEAVRATFSTRGGVLTSWRLKHYAENGAPLDLVPNKAPADAARPFTLLTDDQGVNASLAQALFKPSAEAVNATSAPATLTLEYRDASGLSARKEFSFSPERPYELIFSADVSRGGAALVPTVAWGPALGTGRVSSGMTYSPSSQPIYYLNGTVSRVGFADIPKHQHIEGPVGFAGVDDHYFLAAVVSPGGPLKVQYEAAPVTVEGSERGLHFVSWSVRPPAAQAKLRVFIGPKDFNVLEKADRDLVRAIHFGTFAFLVVPLLRGLNWVNSYIGNYGWSIIALTVMINIVMFPLRHKSVVSMRKMQEIQPEVKSIQDRYSKLKMSDPGRQKMNVELMNLYRERGVNPASGCVPMLLTMRPVRVL